MVTPDELTIDLSSRCNLRCVMCPLERFYQPKDFIDFDLLSKVAHQLDNPELHLRIGWCGEPLMHPRAIDAIGLLTQRARVVEMTTNGMLLDEAAGAGLIEAGLNVLNLSLDASTKELYESIRIRGDFDLVLANIERFIAAKPDALRVNLIATLFEPNLRDAGGLVALAGRLGIEAVAFNVALPHFAEIRSADRMDLAEVKGVLLEARAAHEANGGSFFAPEFQASYGCRFLVPAITPEGELVPCAMLMAERDVFFEGEKTVMPRRGFGNLNEQSLEAILGSGEYRQFIDSATRDHRDSCGFCALNSGYFCP